MSEWQDISAAPKDGTHFLAALGHTSVLCWWCGHKTHPWKFVDRDCEEDGNDIETNSFSAQHPPALWMPLPSPPKERQLLMEESSK